MTEAQKAKVRVLLCGTIPDPRPAVDSKLKLLDEALKDLEMGQGNNFLSMRAMMLDAKGQVRKDLYKPNGDIHLNASGTKIVSLRIQRMLEIMLPALVQGPAPVPAQAPVPAPVVVNTLPVVNVPLVAAVAQAPVVIQHVAVAVQDQVESPMEVEDEDTILQRLFFKKFGRALPEQDKEKEKDDVDQIKFVIDLTDGPDEMEVATSEAAPVVIKTKSIEVTNASKVANLAAARKERRECVKARKAIIAFGKTLWKNVVIPEKEAPTPEKVIAEAPEIVADSDVSEDRSVKSVSPVKSAEQINAEIEADQKEFDEEFGQIEDNNDEFDQTEFRLYAGSDDVDVVDTEEAMIDNI
jgi:hypothetical protein